MSKHLLRIYLNTFSKETFDNGREKRGGGRKLNKKNISSLFTSENTRLQPTSLGRKESL